MKGSHERPYRLEQMVAELRGLVSRHLHGGGFVSADDALALRGMLDLLNDEAAAMRNELSAARWNARAASDAQAETILAEAARPDGKVVLFPVIPRPAFSDGHEGGHAPGGAA